MGSRFCLGVGPRGRYIGGRLWKLAGGGVIGIIGTFWNKKKKLNVDEIGYIVTGKTRLDGYICPGYHASGLLPSLLEACLPEYTLQTCSRTSEMTKSDFEFLPYSIKILKLRVLFLYSLRTLSAWYWWYLDIHRVFSFGFDSNWQQFYKYFEVY